MDHHHLASPSELLQAAESYLLHLHRSLTQIPDPEYTRVSCALPGSTIGKHVRHVLDHFALLLSADPRNPAEYVSYAQRERNPAAQSSVAGGQDAIMKMVDTLRSAQEARAIVPDAPVRIEDTMPGNNEDAAFVSSWGRELWFCTHHMIHHNAVIACLMHEFGLHPPKEFAYAPSTLKHSH
ncbi:hypothetical protein IW140_000839 [Coemansia sp. RSA 1813]|nr:hypothetical protein LPJ74_005669 [Coemansia sp. RSA 1843]KAJ2217191.1 hypothetical protein EV179_000658 [Coemansia sp. RSA 487]KAJ2572388.1 hypothetical protein IW140_000839 [Coemansia sp. RSA 1813]